MTCFDGISVLLVEDEYLIALDAGQILEHLGVGHVEIAASWSRAAQRAREGTFDLAVLDVNLNGRLSYDIADILKERGVPFVFASGYELQDQIPASLKGVACVTKPYTTERLREAASVALAASKSSDRGCTGAP